MAKWIVISGFPRSGQNFIRQILLSKLQNISRCYDLGSVEDQHSGIDYSRLDQNYDLILLHSENYIKNISEILENNKLVILILYRDIRDVFAWSILKENKIFELVFSTWELHQMLHDFENWNRHEHCLILKYESGVKNIDDYLSHLWTFLKDNIGINEKKSSPDQSQTIEENESNNKEGNNTLISEGEPGKWKDVLTLEEIGIIQYYTQNWLLENHYEVKKTIFNHGFIWKSAKIIRHLKNGTLYFRLFRDPNPSAMKNKIKLNSIEEGHILIQLNHELKIKLYNDSKLSQMIISGGYEQDEILFLKRFLKQGDTFIDIGSNIGLYTLHASRLVGKKGKVIAVEPATRAFKRLEENIRINHLSHVQTLNVAISDSKGQTTLYSDESEYDAWNSLTIPATGIFHKKEIVETITLDDLVEKFNLQKINLIKIDVEGFEIPVILGGEKILSAVNSPTLIVEFTEENAQNAGYSCKDLFEKGIRLGYHWYSYHGKTNSLHVQALKEAYPYQNLIAIKNIDALKREFKLD